MRGVMLGLALLVSGTAGAQTIHLGEVERWYLVLGPLQDARACIGADDPLRSALDAMIRDVHGRAMHGINSDYEKGILAGRLAARAEGAPATADDAHCDRVMAHVARGLIRIHAH